MSLPEYLSRGIDYLGVLGAKLRDLQGYRTLAHELIQNADDAANATSMSFDVTDEALVVDNDGVFSECLHVKENECSWKVDGTRNNLCDFHRFRSVAAGDKRGEVNTTGAFGIGFIAVYQITDVPHLISRDRHWILHEDSPEQERIENCHGCATCRQPGLPGTRFILPWARDGDSLLRRALRAEPVDLDGPKRMSQELLASLPVAMLFLRRLRHVVIKKSGTPKADLQRLDDTDSITVSDGKAENDQVWHLIHGEFPDAAATLRQRHQGRIEDKRSFEVTIAIPATAARAGLLCAGLPTEYDTGLPFHINADFFPTNDRKRVILEQDYQSEWNRAAIEAAASAVGNSLDRLRTILGPQRFWGFLTTLQQVSKNEHGEQTFAAFWNRVEPHLKTAKVIYTTNGIWTTSAEASLLSQKDESSAIPLFELMRVNVVHEDLRPYQSLLRNKAVGVPILDISRICEALAAHGLTKRMERGSLPSFLANGSTRATLWKEITLLLERKIGTSKAEAAEDKQRLKEIALAPGRDGAIWPCRELFVADDSTVTLFKSLGADVPFMENDPEFNPLGDLCERFDAKAAIHSLEKISTDHLAKAWNERPTVLSQLFNWFENQRKEILDDLETKQCLARLSIFPSSGHLRRLDELALPGDFNDHLGLAELVDLSALGDRHEFLRDLGMRELDFRTYALIIPAALTNADVAPEKRRAAVELIASRLGEIKDDQAVCRALAASPLVECTDSEFRNANACYFESESVRNCLAQNIYFALIPSDHQTAFRDLYEWLGVVDKPRLSDLVDRVQTLRICPYSPDVLQAIENIVAHLGTIVKEELPTEIDVLRSVAWLPAKGKVDRWYQPSELYAVYQEYLFETQALFLGVPRNTQNASKHFLESLGVNITPTANLVVQHLLHCAGNQTPVNNEVYRFLNQNLADPSLLQLREKKCLLLGDTYRAPMQVFWSKHPFGRFRWSLVEELRAYGSLLDVLGVRENPASQDALAVLREISIEFGAENKALDEDAHAVLMSCWQLLDKAIEEGLGTEVKGLRSEKCVPNPSKVLNPPEWMFFENRAGLAAKFGEFLVSNVIPRPLGAGKAMEAAGVRPLGSAVEIQLLECTDPIEDREMAARIRDRHNQFGRVLESLISGHNTQSVLSRLVGIRYEATTSLLIRYRLTAFNRELESPPEEALAFYQHDPERLLFAPRDRQASWPAIARELAIALFPDEDPGRIAFGLKEVLAAESAQEAAATLDEMGCARLDTSVHEIVESGITSGTLGVGGLPSEHGSTETLAGTVPLGDALPTIEEAIKLLSGDGALVPTPPPHGVTTLDPSAGVGPKPPIRQTSMLRSYVINGNIDSPTEQNPEVREHRTMIEEAGIQKVVTFEQEAGRFPKVMPPYNPGYDIESKDADGKVLHYIEVKSVSGDWGLVEVTHRQFKEARERADTYWLYVVERANQDDARIHRIQNPAGKVMRFVFHDDWRDAAEHDQSEL